MQTPQKQLATLAEIQEIDFSGKHILIADDEAINMMVTSKMLLARNAIISKASNGNEVMQLLTEGLQPDLILLDIKMPELDGFCTIRKIKQEYPHLMVLAFTASFLDEETEALLREKGFYGSLSKSFKPQAFYNTIAVALEANF
jgi:CheY-like chemotaxis protein